MYTIIPFVIIKIFPTNPTQVITIVMTPISLVGGGIAFLLAVDKNGLPPICSWEYAVVVTSFMYNI